METLGPVAVPVDEVQHLVEEQEHRRPRRGEHPGDRLRSGRRGRRRAAEGGDALVAGQLAGEIDPRGLASFRRVPGIAHEDPDPGIGRFRNARRGQQAGHARQRPGPSACAGEMIERGQGVGLSSAELRDEGEHRGGVLRPAGKAPKHHAHVVLEGAGEAGTREELRRVAIVQGRRPGDHLLERNRELVRAERAAFSYLLPEGDDLVPRLHTVCSEALSPHFSPQPGRVTRPMSGKGDRPVAPTAAWTHAPPGLSGYASDQPDLRIPKRNYPTLDE